MLTDTLHQFFQELAHLRGGGELLLILEIIACLTNYESHPRQITLTGESSDIAARSSSLQISFA